MKFLIALCFIFLFSGARSQSWEVHSWGSQTIYYNSNLRQNFIFDNEGNVYKIQPAHSILKSAGGSVSFNFDNIVKLSPDGSLLWQKEVFREQESFYSSLARLKWADDSTIAVFGVTGDSSNIDGFELGEQNCFLLYLKSKNGKATALKTLFHFNAPGNQQGFSLCDFLINKDFILISGAFNGSLHFNDPADSLRSTSWHPVHLCFDKSGKLSWHKVNGSNLLNTHSQAAFGNINIINDRIYSVIRSWDEKDTSFDQLQGKVLKSYILVMDKQGAELGRHYFNDSANASAFVSDALADNENNLYVTGHFEDTLKFGNLTYFQNASSTYRRDYFLIKLDPDLKVLWAKFSEGDSNAWGQRLAIDAENNVYVYGEYFGEKKFEGFKTPRQPFNHGLFLISYNAQGGLLNTRFSRDANYPLVGNIGIDPCNNIYISGVSVLTYPLYPGKAKISFGNAKLIADTLESISFLVRFNPLRLDFRQKKICVGERMAADGDSSFNIFNWILYDTIQFATKEWVVPALNTGKYKLSLAASNPQGCRAYYSDSILVIAKPIAGFSTYSQQACQYSRVFFTDSSKADTVNSQIGKSWKWSWGDGTDTLIKGNDGSVFHTYNSSGIYKISLEFSNGICSDSTGIHNAINIIPALKPGFTVKDNFGCLPYSLIINDTITNAVSKSYIIMNTDNGDSMELTGNGLLHTAILTDAGKYRIAQALTGITGCVSMDTQYVNVVNGFSLGDTLKMVNVTYTNDSTELGISWEKDNRAISYNVFADGLFAGNTRNNHLLFNSSAAKHEFFVSAIDTCGNSSAPSKLFSNVFLSAANYHNRFFLLTYSAFEQWENGVAEYRIKSNSDTLWELIGINSRAGTYKDEMFLQNEQLLYKAYRIEAIENGGNLQLSTSNTVYIPYEPVIFVPNAFTPNGDGLNDIFAPAVMGIGSWRLQVFNRWGERIFEGDKVGWDGTFNKNTCPEGVYMYSIEWKGNTLMKYAPVDFIKGTILLLRSP